MSKLTPDNVAIGLRVRCLFKGPGYKYPGYLHEGHIIAINREPHAIIITVDGIEGLYGGNITKWIVDPRFDYLEIVEAEDVVIDQNRKCYVCNMPAPHAKPNKGEEFICSTCNLLQEIA